MAAKVWLQDRWSMLFPLLQSLTNEQEEEVKRLCEEEIENWRSRDGMSQSSLRVPMTATRKEIKQWELTEANSWLNPRTREKEHIALKYMNFSVEEWGVMNAKSEAKFQENLEGVKFIEDPDAVVSKAAELLKSERWYDLAVALAVLTGRRLEELVSAGELFPKTLYSVLFKGQLKRRDEVLPPYEIPTLIEAAAILDAWRRLRASLAATVNADTSDGRLVSEAANRHFSSLIPGRSGGDLYTHLFRSVYGAIAVFYYAPAEVLSTKYLSTIYGHYWIEQSSGVQQHNYITTMHYQDYAIGDAAVAAATGKRQGVKLGVSGVEVLEVFKKERVIMTKKGKKAMATTEDTTLQTEKASKTGFSMYRPKQDTKDRLDQIKIEVPSLRIDDDVLRLLVDEHYQLQQFVKLGVDLGVLVSLLVDVANDVQRVREEAAKKKVETYTAKKRPLPVTSVDYLRDLVADKRDFSQSYDKRHVDKDYSSMALTELTHTKTTEAAQERFKRAVAAIMAYNDAAAVPEQRWYINAKVVTDLVGGKPSLAGEYLATRKGELEAHHSKYGLTTAYNRRPISIVYRVGVPEMPGGEVDLQAQIEKHEKQKASKSAKADSEEE